jgi:hypothetical protein
MTDLLEYLDKSDSDSDFILESDTDSTSEEDENAPHATSPAANPVSDSEEDDMDDDNYREILSPEQPPSSLPIPRTVWTSAYALLFLLLLLSSISSSQT